MVFKLRKAPKRDLYWVVNTSNGRKFSNDPIPFDNAQGQLRILERWAVENRERFNPEETETSRVIEDVTSIMKTGAFTKQAKKAGMETNKFADYVLKNPDFFTAATRRRAELLVSIRSKAEKSKGTGRDDPEAFNNWTGSLRKPDLLRRKPAPLAEERRKKREEEAAKTAEMAEALKTLKKPKRVIPKEITEREREPTRTGPVDYTDPYRIILPLPPPPPPPTQILYSPPPMSTALTIAEPRRRTPDSIVRPPPAPVALSLSPRFAAIIRMAREIVGMPLETKEDRRAALRKYNDVNEAFSISFNSPKYDDTEIDVEEGRKVKRAVQSVIDYLINTKPDIFYMVGNDFAYRERKEKPIPLGMGRRKVKGRLRGGINEVELHALSGEYADKQYESLEDYKQGLEEMRARLIGMLSPYQMSHRGIINRFFNDAIEMAYFDEEKQEYLTELQDLALLRNALFPPVRRPSYERVSYEPKNVKGGAWSHDINTRIKQFKTLMEERYAEVTNREELMRFKEYYTNGFESLMRPFIEKMVLPQREALNKISKSFKNRTKGRFDIPQLIMPTAEGPMKETCKICDEERSSNQMYSSPHVLENPEHNMCIKCYNKRLTADPATFGMPERTPCAFCRHMGYGKPKRRRNAKANM